jgi:iron complex outermembrane recepter protein
MPFAGASAQEQEVVTPVGDGPEAVFTPQRPGTPGSEIIVTARKREEAAIDVPVIETVITAETIERAAITDLGDIARFAPGLSVGENVLSTGSQISIRGYGTSASDPGVDQSVSLNIDGFTFTQGQSFNSGLFDLSLIEVLKGPQSLFFGKSSPGGVIAIRTADPGPEGEIIARASYEFEAREYRGELIMSTPVVNGFGVRFAGLVWDTDGFFFNKATAAPNSGGQTPKDRVGGGNGYQFRGTVLYEPSPAFEARLKLNYVHDFNEYGGTFQIASCPEGVATSPGNTQPPTINPNDDCTLDRNVYLVDLSPAGFPGLARGGPNIVDRDQYYGTLELNYRPIPDLTLTSVTGYYNIDNDNIGFNAFQTGFSGPRFGIQSFYNREEFQQELRANSDFDGIFNFTVGGFYQDAKVVVRQETYANRELSVTSFFPAFLAGTVHTLNIESISGFGQVRISPTDALEIAVGGRYTHEVRSDDVINARNGAVLPIAVPEMTSNTFSPEVTVSYQPNDDMTLFASYKKGFKAGSYTLTRLPPGSPPDNSFGDEKIEGFEGGIKTRLFDRQLTLNLAGYYYEIEGLQAGVTEADSITGGLPVARTLNAGNGRSYGLDLEASYWPAAVEGLNIFALVNWNKTEFTDFDIVPCYGGQTIALGCDQQFNSATGFFSAQDVSGTPFVRAPEWQATFGAAYEMPLAGGWNLTLSTENQFSSSYRTSLGLRDDYVQDSFVKIGGTIAVESPDERWQLALIGKNLTNEITTGHCSPSNFANSSFQQQITGGTTSGPDGLDELGCSGQRGRSIMVRLTFKPFG